MCWSFCPTSCGGAKKRDKGETREESAEGVMGMGRDRGRDNEEGFGGSRAGRRGTGRRQTPPAPPPPLSQGKGREGSEEDHREGEGKPSLSSFFRPRGLPLSSFPPRDSRAERERERRRPSRSRLAERRPSSVLRAPASSATDTRARVRALSLFVRTSFGPLTAVAACCCPS